MMTTRALFFIDESSVSLISTAFIISVIVVALRDFGTKQMPCPSRLPWLC
jgi:hypothetical protein